MSSARIHEQLGQLALRHHAVAITCGPAQDELLARSATLGFCDLLRLDQLVESARVVIEQPRYSMVSSRDSYTMGFPHSGHGCVWTVLVFLVMGQRSPSTK